MIEIIIIRVFETLISGTIVFCFKKYLILFLRKHREKKRKKPILTYVLDDKGIRNF